MEYWDIYDAKRNLTGKVICRDAQDMLAPGEYHLAVDAWFINDKNQILIQKRSLSKKAYPGLWAQSAGGAVLKGEDSFQACIREVEEELGIIPDIGKTELVHSFIRHGNTIADVYLIHQSISLDKLTLQKSEVEDVKWASYVEIKELLNANKFVPSVMEGLYAILEHNVVILSDEDSID